MRVLVFGDLAQTGFGTVTMDLGHAMVQRGIDVRFASLNEGQWLDNLPDWLGGRVMTFDHPDGWLAMAEEIRDQPDAKEQMRAHVEREVKRVEDVWGSAPWEDGWSPEAAIIIGDMGSVKMSPHLRFLPQGFPVLHYIPVEGVGLPPLWAQVWKRLRPVAMSEFGADQIERLLGIRPPVVYHGVDTDVFRPATSEHPLTLVSGRTIHVLRSKTDCKRLLGMDPDRITVFRADRNVPRKRYPSLLRCLAPVMSRHPEVDFWYHCASLDQGGDMSDERSKYGPLTGWDKDGNPAFGGIAARMNPTGFHDQHRSATRELLAVLYNAADVYVSTSSEGFGLTIAESLACGTPAVALDFSSVPEVVGKAGVLVKPGFYDDNIYSHFWAGVHEEDFTAAVERMVSSRAMRRELGTLGPIHVGAMFRWSKAAEQFEELVAGMVRSEVAV